LLKKLHFIFLTSVNEFHSLFVKEVLFVDIRLDLNFISIFLIARVLPPTFLSEIDSGHTFILSGQFLSHPHKQLLIQIAAPQHMHIRKQSRATFSLGPSTAPFNDNQGGRICHLFAVECYFDHDEDGFADLLVQCRVVLEAGLDELLEEVVHVHWGGAVGLVVRHPCRQLLGGTQQGV
jgi:hypothetical protein